MEGLYDALPSTKRVHSVQILPETSEDNGWDQLLCLLEECKSRIRRFDRTPTEVGLSFSSHSASQRSTQTAFVCSGILYKTSLTEVEVILAMLRRLVIFHLRK